jgi:hypothetical protein
MIRTRPAAYTFCPCGSGKKYKFCCRKFPRRGPVSFSEAHRLLSALPSPPVVASFLTEAYEKDMGLVMATVVRAVPDGGFLAVEALVDRLLLGVKDVNFRMAASPADIKCILADIEMITFMEGYAGRVAKEATFAPDGTLDLSSEDWEKIYEDSSGDVGDVTMKAIPLDYEEVRGFVLGAIDFARSYGQEPHAEWKFASPAFEPDRSYSTNFEYGQEGKPLYIQGPNDDPGKILASLERALREKADPLTPFEAPKFILSLPGSAH